MFGLLTAIVASVVDVDTLVDFLSLGILKIIYKFYNLKMSGTLLAYSIVAVCVIILRYRRNNSLEKSKGTINLISTEDY